MNDGDSSIPNPNGFEGPIVEGLLFFGSSWNT